MSRSLLEQLKAFLTGIFDFIDTRLVLLASYASNIQARLWTLRDLLNQQNSESFSRGRTNFGGEVLANIGTTSGTTTTIDVFSGADCRIRKIHMSGDAGTITTKWRIALDGTVYYEGYLGRFQHLYSLDFEQFWAQGSEIVITRLTGTINLEYSIWFENMKRDSTNYAESAWDDIV